MPDANGSDLKEAAWVGRICSLLDFETRPSSKVGWGVRIGVTLVGTILIYRTVAQTVEPLMTAKEPTPIPTQEFPGDRFRLSEDRRKEIFRELATAELAERKRAIDQNTWNGHAWSREDDRGWWESKTVKEIAARNHISATQVYLVLDEGIRNKWPAPNGEPLPGTTPALNPRTTW